ncbi:atrial natriuretic peptide receptor 1-like [Paramacrobiotus metropolitanus]|uniref:atrial natriuretic peptide receptor 1-like n=1 Tax=Paramacrobiotus metropolitanus TaxID=2943436 RepID=UPI00244566F8|nr:atrial natriuretic peptide receptor 1-like [Paramacrobiotus metropolitanus]
MEADGRNGYLERVPTMDLLVEHLRQQYDVFINTTHIPLNYNKALEGNKSLVPAYYKETGNDGRCDGPKSNIQSVFWPFYYTHQDMFEAPWDEQVTIVMTSGGYRELRACEEAVMELAYATTGVNVPMMVTAPDTRLADVKRFPTVLNMFSMPDFLFVATLTTMADKYSWMEMTVLCTPERSFQNKMCHEISGHLARMKSGLELFTTYLAVDSSNATSAGIYEAGLKLVKERRVTLLLLPPNIIRHFLIAALENGLINGDYVFIAFQIVGIPANDDLYRQDDHTVNDTLLRATFKSLLMVADGSAGADSGISSFFHKLIEEFRKRYNWTLDVGHMNVADPLWLYEQLQVFAQVFLEIQDELPYLRGKDFIRKFLDRTYTVASKIMTLSQEGQMLSLVSIRRFNNELNRFETQLTYDPQSGYLNDTQLSWYTLGNKLPADFPLCGLHGENCWYTRSPEIPIILPALTVAIVITAVLIALVMRQKAHQKQLAKLFIPRDDVTFDGTTEPGYTMQISEDSPLGILTQIRTHKAFCKLLINTQKRYLIRNTKFCQTLATVSELHNRYIAQFYGILVESTTCYLAYEATEKATLRHVIQRSSHFLDADLKTYWITNLIEGVVFVHKSPLKSHGMLSIDVCLIDSRYTIKISLTGYKQLYETLCKDSPTDACDTRQLGLIFAQLFGSANISGEVIPRPNATIPPHVQNLINECLAEETDEKLRKGVLFKRLKSLTQSKNNIVELLLRRLDEYAQSLEGSVMDRTEMLIKETQKVDILLREMFPSAIVSRLRNRDLVLPELFDSATVLFSDIPAFAGLVTVLHPMRIVELLNTMHSRYDEIVGRFDVYKVETISDSYVVVSGVPQRNGIAHATEQCAFALNLVLVGQSVKELLHDMDFLAVRIGINSGPVVAAIVGLRMPRYCLFGDAMNTASRMESHGAANMVHVTTTTKRLVESVDSQRFLFEPRGSVLIKGKGLLETFWLIHDSGALTRTN